jgi:hypothetical protein
MFVFFLFIKFLISSLIALQWSLLIFLVVYYFRLEIKKLIERGFTFKKGDTSIDFHPQQISLEKNSEVQNVNKKKSEPETLELLSKKESESINKDQQIFKLTLEKHFEYTYRIIFRSQIFLLQRLQVFPSGLPLIQVTSFFEEEAKNKFEFYRTNRWTTDTYLSFLYGQNLIEIDSLTKNIKLTTIGDIFLKYLILSSYNAITEKNL